MTVTLTYPGVYLVETASVPYSVVPATTNLTAFVGTYAKGPTDKAMLVSSWDEFNSTYGGLVPGSLATYGVWQFFLNGGIGAWIVRIAPPGAAPATGIAGPLQLLAKSPGAWANGLYVEIDPFQAGRGTSLQTLANVTVYSASGTGAQVLEALPNLPFPDLDTLAAAIDGRSNYVDASPVSETAALKGTWASPPSGPIPFPPVTQIDSQGAVLANGVDGAFADGAAFVTAVEAQLGMSAGPSSPGAAPTPVLLDAIAPQVFNLLCIPDAAWLPADEQSGLYSMALSFCEERQAFFIVDPPPPAAAAAARTAPAWGAATVDNIGADPLALDSLTTGAWADNLLTAENYSGATYYPWLVIPDPANGQRPCFVPPSGTVAGLYAATDVARGVWKAPAGTAVVLQGVSQLADRTITDAVNGQLNILGLNCLRTFPVYGNIVWGARTLAGSDYAQSPYKYVPVRRLSDFIEQSLQQSLRWAVFEPNGPTLWASITLEVGSFMAGLFSDGAFSGATAAAAYQITCDATTTTEQDMLNGVVNVVVAFSPVEPAEFVVLNIQLTAGPAGS
jgi:hypothetical protein